MREPLRSAAEVVRKATSILALTGAGISVESGIPDFRSPGGIWDRFPPEEFATIQAFLANPDRVWKMWYELRAMLGDVKPNAAHLALAALERRGKLEAVITQNIDNLHQAAGSQRVIEYHGNAARTVCISCGRRAPFAPEPAHQGAPRCACGGILKPDVVLFGEQIPVKALLESERLARSCDVMLVIGTSASVYPAAELPLLAKEHGAVVIECNLEATDFTGSLTDHFLQGPAGETLPALVAALSELENKDAAPGGAAPLIN